MRKTLIATSALAFAGALAAGQASAADMLSVGVGGYMEQWVGFVDREDSADKSVEGGIDQWSDSEIHFKGKLETDTGLTFSVKVELEGNTSGDTIDESQLTVGGSFGQIVLGSEDHPAALMHYGNQDVGVGYCGDSGWTGVTGCSRNTELGFGTNGWIVGGDEQKIAYYTPRISGMQLGAAYIPDHTAEDSNGAPNGNDHAGWSAGLNLQHDVGDVSVAASVGHYQVSRTMDDVALKSGMNDDKITVGTYMDNNADIKAYADARAGDSATTGDTDTLEALRTAAAAAEMSNAGAFDTMMSKADDQTWTNFGLQVGFGSFSFNVAYAEHDGGAYMVDKDPIMVNANAGFANSTADCSTDGTISATAAYCFTTTAEGAVDVDTSTDGVQVRESASVNDTMNDTARTVLVKDTSQDYDLMSVGMKYSEGPLAVSLTHMMGEADDGTEGDVTMLSVAYKLAPGVASKTSIISGEQGTKEGTAFVTGIAIGF